MIMGIQLLYKAAVILWRHSERHIWQNIQLRGNSCNKCLAFWSRILFVMNIGCYSFRPLWNALLTCLTCRHFPLIKSFPTPLKLSEVQPLIKDSCLTPVVSLWPTISYSSLIYYRLWSVRLSLALRAGESWLYLHSKNWM